MNTEDGMVQRQDIGFQSTSTQNNACFWIKRKAMNIEMCAVKMKIVCIELTI